MVITSKDNQYIRLINELKKKKYREKYGMFLAEEASGSAASSAITQLCLSSLVKLQDILAVVAEGAGGEAFYAGLGQAQIAVKKSAKGPARNAVAVGGEGSHSEKAVSSCRLSYKLAALGTGVVKHGCLWEKLHKPEGSERGMAFRAVGGNDKGEGLFRGANRLSKAEELLLLLGNGVGGDGDAYI